MSASAALSQALDTGAGLTDTPRPKRRPQTQKPRGICQYYTTPRGCFAGDKCKFLHEVPPAKDASQASGSTSTPVLLTPYDQSKRCHFFARGYCKRGEDCWFRHVQDIPSNGKGKTKEDAGSDSETYDCSICLEAPVTYGLLGGCGHIFCISCIKQWRDPNSKSIDVVSSGNNKKCPMCRTSSYFITPSSVFLKHGSEEKDATIAKYKESMSRVDCRYFQKTRPSGNPMCPFGKDCFYKHEKADGTIHVFDEGASFWMSRYAARRRPFNNFHNILTFSDSDSDDLGGFGFPFDIDTFPYLDLFGATLAAADESDPPEEALGNVNRQPIEVSMGQINIDSWNVVLNPTRRRREGNNAPPVEPGFDAPNDPGPSRRRNAYQTSRTIRDIGHSLEALTDAMNTGALDRIGYSVQHLQDRLRREELVESGSVERLQNLAGQMLASIELLQTANVTRLNATTPATNPIGPPLPTVDRSITASTTTTTAIPTNRTRRPAPTEDDTADDDSGDLSEDNDMPALQSISSSSEDSDYDEDDEDDDSEAEYNDDNLSIDGGENSEWTANPWLAVRGQQVEAPFLAIPSPTPESDAFEFEVAVAGEEELRTQGSASETPTPIIEPPYVTDGRGRVVWTSSESSEANTPLTSTTPNPPRPSPSTTPAPPPPTMSVVSPRNRTPASSSTTRKSAAIDTPLVQSAASSVGGGGFATDGRGRVIAAGVSSTTTTSQTTTTTNAAAGDLQQSQEAVAQESTLPPNTERSFLGRVLDAISEGLFSSEDEY